MKDSLVSMAKRSTRRVYLLFFTTLVSMFFWIPKAYPTIYPIIGVSSNFLIDDGRVFFAQADDSLTVLDLKTGVVIERKKERLYSGTLLRIDEGILVLTYNRITLLDSKILTPIWETDKIYKPNIIEGFLVSYDGNSLVECRDLHDGKVCWSYNLPGALDIVAEKGKVLIHRAATFEGSPVIVLINLQTGEELFKKVPPPGMHYGNVYFDGERIYLESGPFSAHRYNAIFDKMIILDLSGKEISSINVPSGFKKLRRYTGEPFFSLGDKIFARERVWASHEAIPPIRPGSPHNVRKYNTPSNKEATEYIFKIDSGWVVEEAIEKAGKTIELKSRNAYWKGTLPYLKKFEDVVVVAEAENKLLLGTNVGHVECIEMTSGRSLWIYVFPTMFHGIPYKSNGETEFLDRQAEIFHLGNERNVPSSGMRLFSQEESNKPSIILDPKPWNPFSKLPLYLAIAWTEALFPIIIFAVLSLVQRRRTWDSRISAIAGLVLATISALCFFHYRRISHESNIASRLAISIILISAIVYTFRVYREGRWKSATIILVCLIVFGLLVISKLLYP
jgi:hypothetical protein